MHLRRSSLVTGGQGTKAAGIEGSTQKRPPVPVFDDLIERIGLTRPPVAVAVGVVLFLLYVLSVYADGFQEWFTYSTFWKGNIEPPVILSYVLLVHYFLDGYGRRAVQALRPAVDLDDLTFNELVTRMSATILRFQWVPMVAFALLSVPLLESWDWSYGFRWSSVVSRSIATIEYAVIGSAIYLVVARNLFFTSLFRQPLNIDVFNPAPVRPMGRWGLSVAAAIMGGVTISVLLVGDAQEILSFEHLPMYLVATAASVLAFFGSMSSTHRVLVHAKDRELNEIRGNLSNMYRELKKRTEMGKLQGMDEMTNAITAWLGYEKRIVDAQEWPYTTNTLRGLFATVLLPVTVTIIQQIILWL